MTTLVERNKQLARDLFAGTADRHAFQYQPTLIPLTEVGDYTLSDTFGGIGMHCCADAEHQFPGFNKIRNFYAFNRVQSKHGYRPILEHFGGPGAPVHCLAWGADDGSIGCLFEQDRYEYLTFARFSMEWLAGDGA